MDSLKDRVTTWLKDGGAKSRKMWMSIGAAQMVLGGALVAAHWPSFASNYEAYVGGIIGVLSLYLTGNVTSRWAAAKHVVAQTATAMANKTVARPQLISQDPLPGQPEEQDPEQD